MTHAPLRHFIIGNFAMIPGLALRIFIGTTLSTLTSTDALKKDPLLLGMIVVGLGFAIAGIVYISIVTKRHLKAMDIGEAAPAQEAPIEAKQS